MDSERELHAWLVLTRTPRLALTDLQSALARCGSARQLLSMPPRERAASGLSAAACEFLRKPAAAITRRESAWLEQENHAIIHFQDPRFPAPLRALKDCPIALYVDGASSLLSSLQVAIVGSRNPSAQGRANAYAFAGALAARNVTITSGLAEGIDAAAHLGAIAQSAPTIGVLGTGIDIVYPRSNRRLAAQIERCGALVSAFVLGTRAARGNFPRRNRIIAALSRATLVIEAARNSGSLITARHARKLGRKVFALPGSIHDPLAHGCHELIREGATLAENADDILSELADSDARRRRPVVDSPRRPAAEKGRQMDKDREILLDALGFEPTGPDVLVLRTGFKPETVSSMMLILELEGHVERAHGGRFTRVARSP